jgi:poly-gamma-glutamate synthesis protein (capsule biosynthesis protein)
MKADLWLVATLALAACTGPATSSSEPGRPPDLATTEPVEAVHGSASPRDPRVVTLAFAGDVHFQLNVSSLLAHPEAGLGPVDRALASADVAMVNLESAITERGSLDPKELEAPGDRFWYRAPPAALDLLDAAGVDVVSMANNHGADYGPVGLRDTLRAARTSPVAVVGVGRDRESAFTAYRTTVRGTRLAFLAGDASPREGRSSTWAAGPSSPGLAAAHQPRPRALLDAVRAADRGADVVVVYMHWGLEGHHCPTDQQRSTARALVRAGADVVVGSHAHVLLGAGRLDGAYVDYGLGNFVWYHDNEPETGVLRLRLQDGEVVADAWLPGRIHTWGAPRPLRGPARDRAVADWRALRACAGLGG